jgi:Ni/Co efflux regulator RcnB
MMIWILMAVVLVAIVAGGFVTRGRRNNLQKAEQERNRPHETSHHGKQAHNHRGRGSH